MLAVAKLWCIFNHDKVGNNVKRSCNSRQYVLINIKLRRLVKLNSSFISFLSHIHDSKSVLFFNFPLELPRQKILMLMLLTPLRCLLMSEQEKRKNFNLIRNKRILSFRFTSTSSCSLKEKKTFLPM